MSLTIADAFALADKLVRAPVDLVESLLQLRPQLLHFGVARIGRHADRRAARDHATAERKMNDGTVPVVHALEPACRDRHRQNRPAGFARKHDDAKSGLTRHFRYVSRERHVGPVLQRAQHALERAYTALAMEIAAMRARTADGFDVQPFG